ncbi:MAG: 16S rRNA (cytosine(1402)-N(4))-methyltransferase RsmH [Verrucomicrobiota bacterium]|nr:16S rRNA (cytosine(1402)-N(4))-methyltransferase RsmH [Verrucomicrobiota bacterium]
MEPHLPVLLHEIIEAFAPVRCARFFDGTVGAGGHARALLTAHPEIECYFACDRDPSALLLSKEALSPWQEKVQWIQGSFSKIGSYLDEAVDGVLLDLGVSSMQLDTAERGFSFRMDAPLDMRMDPLQGLTAEQLVNELPEEELANLFFKYGEERASRRIARALVQVRRKERIRTTLQLANAVERVVPRHGRLHPATRVFQALRIAVNDELGEVKKGIYEALSLLRPHGRMAVISFHSLEDREVKRIFRESTEVERVYKKAIAPTREECLKNPRARSAKLRVVEKKG